MELLILGSVLLIGGLFAAFDQDNDDDDDSTPPEGTASHGTDEGDLLDAAGQDTLSGWGGDDTLTGQDDAVIFGNRGDDEIAVGNRATGNGGAGEDTIRAEGDATANGGAGDDTLWGSDEADLTGGAGEDLFGTDFADGQRITVTDFSQGDRLGVAFEDWDMDNLDLSSTTDAEGGFTDVTLANGDATTTFRLMGVTEFDPESLRLFPGSAGEDDPGRGFGLTEGTAQGDDLDVSQSDPSQVLLGHDGDDTLTGNYLLYGGAGDDQVTGFEMIHGGSGNDTVSGLSSVYGDEGDDLVQGNGALYGGEGDDRIEAQGFDGEYDGIGMADGGAGNDTIVAMDDTRDGSGAFHGGEGDDLLQGTGNSTLDGGAGDDLIEVRTGVWQAAHGFVTTGEGADTVVIDSEMPETPLLENPSSDSQTLITDFDTSLDRLVLHLPAEPHFDVDVTITPDAGGQFTDIVLSYQGSVDGVPIPDHVIRLAGVSDFSAEDLVIVDEMDAAA